MRRIFVPLHQAETVAAQLDHAALFAADAESRLDVAFVPHLSSAEDALADEDQAHADACRAALQDWETAVGRAAAPWREIPDGAVYASASFGRASDLIVTTAAGPGRPADPATSAGGRALRDALLASGRAVLLLPAPAPLAGRVLDHVVVAWDGSAGAARALGQAAAVLPRAQRLTVMIIGRNTLGERARQSVADYAGLHNEAARLLVLDNTHRQTGRVLLEAMRREQASLVVMGVCGRSHPMGSTVGLGGTILKVVEDNRVPVLTAG